MFVCLFVVWCNHSSSFRFTSSLSFRVWRYPWPLCPWAWLSPPCPPSPPALASCHCPASSRHTRTWPRRTRALVTGLTATARMMPTNPTSLRRDGLILSHEFCKEGRSSEREEERLPKPSFSSLHICLIGLGLIQSLSLSVSTANLSSVILFDSFAFH